MATPSLFFNLSAGNPSNNPVGLSIDSVPFGQSLGGKIFRSQTLPNGEELFHNLTNDTLDVFDSIVPSDIIKSYVNYRAVFISNLSADPYVLDEISVSEVVSLDGLDLEITDVDIAYEGVYTLQEVNRELTVPQGKASNPSLVLDDEYDSTNKLAGKDFTKVLDYTVLPSDIPSQAVLKLWIRRRVIIDKLDMPDEQVGESFTLSIKEYDTDIITSLKVDYIKLEGRVRLSNWYDYTITLGRGNQFVMRELIPKNVDISSLNVIDIFSVNGNVLIFYYQLLSGQANKVYYLLSIQPNAVSTLNKYVQVRLQFDSGLSNTQEFLQENIVSIKKSYYDQNKFYLFADENIAENDPCVFFYFGYFQNYDRISMYEIMTHIWTDSVFTAISPGWDNRRVESYNVIDRKVVREQYKFVNVEQINDLFIIFTNNTTNKELNQLEEVSLNKNELLYVFEKDFDSQNNEFKSYPGINSQMLSQRLLPASLPRIQSIKSKNFAKNSNINVIISESSGISRDTSSDREIKFLLDGTRYVNKHSVHGREFKIGQRFVTYELPDANTLRANSLLLNTCIKVISDQNIYEEKRESFNTTFTLPNVFDGNEYPKPWFQRNIIDSTSSASQSVPLEWLDRIYKDQYIEIAATLPIPNSENTVPSFTLLYNFRRNLWKTKTVTNTNTVEEKIHNHFESQSPQDPTGKSYYTLNIDDYQYVLEPDYFTPISIKTTIRNVHSTVFNQTKYIINYQVFFKGLSQPIIETNAFSTEITNISYMFINPAKKMNISMNYMDLIDANNTLPVQYYVQNNHNALLDNLNITLSPEFKVDPIRQSNQAEFNFYRIVVVDNMSPPQQGQPQFGEVVIPITLFGNGYKTQDDTDNPYLTVSNPFNFNKLDINDSNIRIYSDSNTNSPLPLNITKYEYDKDYIVLWVRLTDASLVRNKLYLYYGKIDIAERKDDVFQTYSYLKSNLYPKDVLGAWNFGTALEDPRLSFSSGKIFKMGDPVVYEKSFGNELKLSRIDKEYFFGLAQVYKSNRFIVKIDIDSLDEDELLFNTEYADSFKNFLKDVITIFKPGYTEVNDIKPSDISIYETTSGEVGMTNNKFLSGLIALTPNRNVNTYYNRVDNNKFDVKTSYNGFSDTVDWAIANNLNSSIFKAGVHKVSGRVKSDVIRFESPFKNTDYFVFVSNPVNQKLYWNLLCEDRISVSSSHSLRKEICWMAFHRDIFGGVFTPDSIYVGSRTITGSTTTIDVSGPSQPNLTDWVDGELIIQPDVGVQGDPGEMNIDPTDPGYAILLSCNKNINIYWTEKNSNSFRIKTSAPVACKIHWAVIRNGVEWWKEII
jgi:hypothetical protein